MSEKKAKALRALVKEPVKGRRRRRQMARDLRKHRDIECPKIDTKALKRRRKSIAAQKQAAAERRFRRT